MYTLSDLAVTFATDINNAPMIDLTRLWKSGVQAHVLVDQDLDLTTLKKLGSTYNETYTALPGFPGHPAALRAVMAPMFAAEALGLGGGPDGQPSSFKWLLVGDADTVWVLRAVLDLLNDLNRHNGLDAEEPHMLSDFLVECDPRDCRPDYCPVCYAPKRVDRRCLPCPDAGRLCPCKLPESCTRPRTRPTDPLPEDCPVQLEVSAYGGAGIIYSVGLLRQLMADPRFYAAEALKTLVYDRPYGDVALAEIVRLAGYGFTQLPPAPPPLGSSSSDNDLPDARYFSQYSYYNDRRTAHEQLIDMLKIEHGAPGALKHMVSFHVHTWPGPDFGSRIAPPYRSIVRLLTRRPMRMAHGGRGGSSRG